MCTAVSPTAYPHAFVYDMPTAYPYAYTWPYNDITPFDILFIVSLFKYDLNAIPIHYSWF